jgi:hypothetical protein
LVHVRRHRDGPLREEPGARYLRTALPLLALSLAVPLTAADTAISTKLTLPAAHLIAGAVIVPIVVWRLSRATVRAVAG